MADRTMYDAITPRNMPGNGDLYAGYTSGNWPTFNSLAGLFPGRTYVSIAVNAGHVAQVLDVEKGDATAEQAPGWLTWMRSLRIDPTVYCSTSVWPQVVHACQAAGVALCHWWEARYGDGPDLLPGRVAHQYTDTGNYDISIVVPAGQWPGVDHNVPTPSTAPMVAPGFIIAAAVPLAADTEVPMKNQVITVPTDSNGNGCFIADGLRNTVYGVGSIAATIPWNTVVCVEAQGSCPGPQPGGDGVYWGHVAHRQDRSGYLLVSVTGGPKLGQANVIVTTTS